MVPTIKAKKPKATPKKPFGRRLGEGLRASGEFSRDAIQRPGSVPDKAHGAFRSWFRNVWDAHGGGLYAVGFAVAFLFFEIREIVTEDIPQFVAMNSIFSSELIEFGIQFIVDTMANVVRALVWPAYVVGLWPPAGAIARHCFPPVPALRQTAHRTLPVPRSVELRAAVGVFLSVMAPFGPLYFPRGTPRTAVSLRHAG